jgi:O-antigen ligase
MIRSVQRIAPVLALLAAALVFLPVGASGLAALLWLGAALAGLVAGGWPLRREGRVWLLAWAGWMLLSLAWSGLPPAQWARPASHVVILLAVPALAASVSAAQAEVALRAFVVAALVLAAAWLWHALWPLPPGRVLSSMVHYAGNKSIANGVLMALAVALAAHFGWSATRGSLARRGWWLAAALLAAMVLWRSASRTSHGVLMVLPLALALWRARTLQGRLVALAAAASVAMAAAVWFGYAGSESGGAGGLAARHAAGQLQASDDNRRELYAATWRLIEQRPLAGHGLGSWALQWQQSPPREDMRGFNTAHSAPLELLAEGGVVALLLLGGALAGWLGAARRAGLAGAGAPAALVLLAWALASLVNATLRDAAFTAPMVVLLALALAAAPPPDPSLRSPPGGTPAPPH